VYAGRASSDLLPKWETRSRTVSRDGERERTTTDWIDPDTGMRITRESTLFL
jgi:hypothetical protein